MRTKLLSFLLIISFFAGSLPTAFAQEAPVPEMPVVEAEPVEPVIEAPVVEPETPVEELPSEPGVVPVIEEPALVPGDSASSTEEVAKPLSLPAPIELAVLALDTESVEPFINLVIRHGENVAWSGTTTLPASGTRTATPTGDSEEISIATDSLLSVLLNLDAETDDFAIADLDYYSSLGSFLINCISAETFGEQCSQWQFVVNGQYASVGIDDYILSPDDDVYLYYGSPRRVVLSDTNVSVGESFTATAQSYDPTDNSYDPLAAYTIGVTQFDPANPWTPIEVATSTSAADGTATFTVPTEGTYDVAIKIPSEWGDYYDYPPTALIVSSTTESGGGTGGGEVDTGFDVAAAYDFLKTGQDEDGSWDSELVTDWSAIALALSGAPSDMKSSLADFLREEEVNLDTPTDYERHAMALMAFNINPYTGGQEDYITPIVESFNGTQIDDPDENGYIVNDDAFGLIVLLNAGYTKDDAIIKAITNFILSEQRDDGSWEGGVDVSGPYIQALKKVSSLPGVAAALSDAESYMRSVQEADGGFGDPFATAWAVQGIEALGQSSDTWIKGDNTPLTYLADMQDEDGGMVTDPDNYFTRSWATAYAIPAVKGVTWDEVLRNFKKPASSDNENEKDEDGNNTDSQTATTTTATITEEVPPPPLEVEEEVVIATTTLALVMPYPEPPQTSEVVEEPVEEPAAPNPLVAGAGQSGAWEWLKKFFLSIWSSITGLF